MLRRDQKLAIYMEGELRGDSRKMCSGILRYSPNEVTAIIDSTNVGCDVREVMDSPRFAPVVATLDDAFALGADVLVLGVATPGGLIPEAWYPALDEAVAKGFSILNGLHDRLQPRYQNLKACQWIWDVRVEPEGLGTGKGEAATLQNKRLLMIGTDMAIGKMTAGLEIFRLALQQGIRTEFVATGQIGIAVTGKGVPLDAVRVDYASSAIEREVMSVATSELVIIEGQGALIHPGSTANLPLLRGSCPTHLIVCHRAGQTHLWRLPHIAIPPLHKYVQMYEDLAEACGNFPRPKTVAVALNTAGLDDEAAGKAIESVARETGLPTADPVREGANTFLRAMGF